MKNEILNNGIKKIKEFKREVIKDTLKIYREKLENEDIEQLEYETIQHIIKLVLNEEHYFFENLDLTNIYYLLEDIKIKNTEIREYKELELEIVRDTLEQFTQIEKDFWFKTCVNGIELEYNHHLEIDFEEISQYILNELNENIFIFEINNVEYFIDYKILEKYKD